jgi:hypothetical protein
MRTRPTYLHGRCGMWFKHQPSRRIGLVIGFNCNQSCDRYICRSYRNVRPYIFFCKSLTYDKQFLYLYLPTFFLSFFISYISFMLFLLFCFLLFFLSHAPLWPMFLLYFLCFFHSAFFLIPPFQN